MFLTESTYILLRFLVYKSGMENKRKLFHQFTLFFLHVDAILFEVLWTCIYLFDFLFICLFIYLFIYLFLLAKINLREIFHTESV